MISYSKLFLRKLFLTPTGRNSLVMVVGSILVGVVNYLFHPVINYLLGPERYGEIASLITIFSVISVSIIALSTVLVKFTATYKAKGDFASVFSLLKELTRKLTIFGLVVFFLLAVFSPDIAHFLKLSSPYPVLVLGALIFVAFLFYVNMGILQGLLEFFFYTFSNLVMASLRIVLPLLAIIIFKFSVTGVMVSVALAILSGYLVSFFPLKFLFKEKSGEKISWRPLIKFSFETFLTVLGSAFLVSIDIILVKHFFSPIEAGVYATGSTLGKIILFSTSPIAQVMFPLIAERQASEKKYLHLLVYALSAVFIFSFGTTLLYILFPGLIVSILFPKTPEVASYISLFGVLISIYSLVNVFINFFLSIQKTAMSYVTLSSGVLLGVLIWFFHSDLYEVLRINILVNLLLLGFMVVYFFITYAKKRA